MSFLEQPWVPRLGWTLLHFLWQGALIAIAYAAARRWWTPSRNPNARYLLACLALLAMVAAPIVTWGFLNASAHWSAKNPYVGVIPPTSETIATNHATSTSLQAIATHAWSDDVMPWLVMAWFAGAIVFWARLMGGWVVTARMRSMLVRAASPEWQRTLDDLRTKLRVSQPVKLLISAMVQVPTVLGSLRPVVLVPVGALAGLPPDHIEALLAHELAHIRRHDYFVNILQSAAESLLFYHPAVWWISGHIRSERELCCDDAAVEVSGDAMSYAQALASLEAYRPAHFLPALAANGGSLPERIGRLIGQPARIPPPRPAQAATLPALLIAVAACALFGQTTPLPSFEAVSIKPNDLGGGHVHMQSSPERLEAEMTTKTLIKQAFGIKDFQVVGGPSWLDQNNYTFVAVAGSSLRLTKQTQQQCLQSLLASRFQFRFHRETRQLPVYTMLVAKGGPKLTPHTGAGGQSTNSTVNAGRETMDSKNLSMADLASFLTNGLDRPVLDRTGIKGTFDVKLEWSPDQADASLGPSIFTALEEQLGLRLSSTGKGPVEVLVIDSVDKPSEN